jgi:benzoyl-CoA 2,3-epoxidase subunit B
MGIVTRLLRDDYMADGARGVARWNQVIQRAGVPFELKLPNRDFHRAIGGFAGVRVSPGRVDAHRAEWLSTEADEAFLASLMQPVVAAASSPTGSSRPRGVSYRQICEALPTPPKCE